MKNILKYKLGTISGECWEVEFKNDTVAYFASFTFNSKVETSNGNKGKETVSGRRKYADEARSFLIDNIRKDKEFYKGLYEALEEAESVLSQPGLSLQITKELE